MNENKVAIITGAAKNIGREICLQLAELNFNILIHANTDKTGAQETLELVKKHNVNSKIILGDLTDERFVKDLIDTSKSIGDLCILINNASQRNFIKFNEMNYKQWKEIIDINLNACFLTTKYALTEMLKNNWGRVINMGGLSGHIGAVGRAHVVTSKIALVGFTRALATEFAETGITFNCVVPGLIDTIRGVSSGQGLVHPTHKSSPMKRMGKPKEVASMIKNLCDAHSGYINGQTIHVNGGSYYS